MLFLSRRAALSLPGEGAGWLSSPPMLLLPGGRTIEGPADEAREWPAAAWPPRPAEGRRSGRSKRRAEALEGKG